MGNEKERGGSRAIAESVFEPGNCPSLSNRPEEVGIARPKRGSNLAIVPQSSSYSNSSSYSVPSLIFPNSIALSGRLVPRRRYHAQSGRRWRRHRSGPALFPASHRSLALPKGFAHDERTGPHPIPLRPCGAAHRGRAKLRPTPGDSALPLLSGYPSQICALEPKITVRAEPSPYRKNPSTSSSSNTNWGTRKSEEGRGRSQRRF